MWDIDNEGHESLDEIIRNKNLTALFQPIINLNNAEIFGYEGLIRGPSDSSLHSPLRLLSAAREAGRLYELEDLCRQVVTEEFIRLNLPGKLFLNVSPDVLVLHNLRNGSAKGLLHHIGLPTTRVVIELTEGERAADHAPEKLLEAAAKCRTEGYSVAIDDLGEGFSSLRLWSELRPAFVKVDRHFIQNIDQDPVKVQFVRSIQEIALRSECAIIAEGIETHSELMVAKSLGVAYGQGYYIARPHSSPGTVAAVEVSKALKSFSTETRCCENMSWARNSIAARGIVHEVPAVSTRHTNQEVFHILEASPQLAAVAVVENDGTPAGLINRSAMIDHFARRFRHELFGKKPCTLFMDDKPLLVDKASSVQEVSKLLVNSDSRHLTQGFIVTDQGRYFGVAYGQDLMRVITDMQIQAAKYANPLTQLPGNVPIYEHVDGLLRAQTPFCACYCDLDSFKPFNDVYGFSAGDEVIKLTASILARVCDHELDFIGHIGGDDFIILFRSINWQERCNEALAEFGEAILNFFGPEEIARGGYITENRRGEKEFHPLTSLSIGAASVPPGVFSSYMEVSRIASQAKKQAKRMPGNSLFVNQRDYQTMDQETVPG